jgi:hypothetical protein
VDAPKAATHKRLPPFVTNVLKFRDVIRIGDQRELIA